MKKFRVIGIIGASVNLGVFEAETKEEAKEMSYDSDKHSPDLCHHCADQVDLGDIYMYDIEEVEDGEDEDEDGEDEDEDG